MISPSYRRFIMLAASIFIISSIYLSMTRLFAMTLTPQQATYSKGSGTGSNDRTGPSDVRPTDPNAPVSYGDYERPKIQSFDALVGHLDEDVIPTPSNQRRLIIVGDIHGMVTALDELLKKVEFNATTDHLIAVGDMVNKGPDSGDVLQRLIKLRASAVRGNHEDRVLQSRAEIDSQMGAGVSADLVEKPETEDKKGQLSDLVTARLLTQEQIDWLAKLPVIIHVKELGIYVVHAGLMPGIGLKEQDPWAAMNMRTIVYPREGPRSKGESKSRGESESDEPLRRRAPGIDQAEAEAIKAEADKLPEIPETSEVGRQHGDNKLILDDDIDDDDLEGGPGSALKGEPRDGPGVGDNADYKVDTSEISFDRAIAVPSSGSEGDPWNEAWDTWQRRLHHGERYTVIYGHDARHGYIEGNFTFGLDSGCVKGNELTAMIVTAREGGGFMHQRAQVTCHGR